MQNKLLILGGRPIGSCELVIKAKELGCYTIVTDYLPISKSPAKQIADESWDISTADVDKLVDLCRHNKVTAITTGVHEFNINRMIEISSILGLPCYCKPSTWKYCDDKIAFKYVCQKYGIPVAKKYELNYVEDTDFPLITKPVDGSGSRGFHICQGKDELLKAYKDAECYSPTKSVLIEEYIPYNAVIIHYTMVNGICHYSGMSDKKSVRFKNTGSSVMGFQTFPSIGEKKYLQTLDERVRFMFENAGFTEGPIWIEAFFDGNDRFIFNEMGYRFGGSLTYFPVHYFYSVNQLDLYLYSSLGKQMNVLFERINDAKKYCILPIHIKPGIVNKIVGLDDIKRIENYYAMAPVHYIGDEIKEWGSAQQVFCYLHVLYDDLPQLKATLAKILDTIQVLDAEGKNMLFTLYDINRL